MGRFKWGRVVCRQHPQELSKSCGQGGWVARLDHTPLLRGNPLKLPEWHMPLEHVRCLRLLY